MVVFSHPEAVQEIFRCDADEAWAGASNTPLAPFFGSNSLLLLDGHRHLRRRRLLAPRFHGETMRSYGRIVQLITDRTVDTWRPGETLSLHAQMQAISLDVILWVVLGPQRHDFLIRTRAEILEMLNVIATLATPGSVRPGADRCGRPWNRALRARMALEDTLSAELDRHQAHPEATDDLLCLLLSDAGEDCGEARHALLDEVIGLLVAGHETTATALAWAFQEVLGRQDILERLRKAMASCVSGAAAELPILPTCTSTCTYTEATIKETLRLHPVFAIVGRRLRQPMRIGGIDLPADVIAAPCIYLTHRRGDFWRNPTRFDPDRFVGAGSDPRAFFPFGGGARRCLGMHFAIYEMKIILERILSRVVLRPTTDILPRVVRRSVTLAPGGGVPVVVEAWL
jgi:cytochrome P450